MFTTIIRWKSAFEKNALSRRVAVHTLRRRDVYQINPNWRHFTFYAFCVKVIPIMGILSVFVLTYVSLTFTGLTPKTLVVNQSGIHLTSWNLALRWLLSSAIFSLVVIYFLLLILTIIFRKHAVSGGNQFDEYLNSSEKPFVTINFILLFLAFLVLFCIQTVLLYFV